MGDSGDGLSGVETSTLIAGAVILGIFAYAFLARPDDERQYRKGLVPAIKDGKRVWVTREEWGEL